MPLSSQSERITSDEFLANAAWQPGQERARAQYEAAFDRAVMQIDHERTCGQCQRYALPSHGTDRYGAPCAVGRRFWAQPFGGNRDNLRIAS